MISAAVAGQVPIPSTTFVVCRLSSVGAVRRAAFIALNSIGFEQKVTANWAYTRNEIDSGVASDTSSHTFSSLDKGGVGSELRKDGSSIALGSPTSVAATQLAIGGFTGGIVPWIGDIAEVINYSGALSSIDIQLVEAYLKAKWGTP